MSFTQLGLSDELLRAVNDQGYTTPTPVQTQAIPVILSGRDIMAGAQTGTGKTAGFTLPLLQRLHQAGAPSAKRAVRALVLTPTRELAAQVADSVRAYGKYLPLKSTALFGGVNIKAQITALRAGVDIVVATPGRLLDHVNQKTVNLSKVEILVLDEADRMLDMGFINDIRKILALLPRERQNLLFSATFSDEIKQLADRLLNAPALIEVERRNSAAGRVTQTVHPVDRERKRELLAHLISSQNLQQVLVFTRTKHGADRLAGQLDKDGIETRALHGNKSQSQRSKALHDFKKGRARVLVATDIAARGIDIDQLPHVVNFELPHVAEDYVHRIGRTGRAGASGHAISLVCIDEQKLLGNIRRVIKQDIATVVIPSFEPDASIKAEPITRGGKGGKGGHAPRRGQAPRAKSAAQAKATPRHGA
ncbi:MAG: DEAD/DEAH box helicase, partial [Pseudomonadota bacterium]